MPSLAIMLLVFATAFFLALGPRLLDRLASEALVSELLGAPAVDRNVELTEGSQISGEALPKLEDAQAATSGVEQQLPVEIQPLVGERRFVVDSTSFQALSGTRFESLFFLRVQEGIEQHVDLVSGRVPSGHVEIGPDPRPGSLPEQRAAVYEVMLSEPTATQLGLGEGQLVPLDLSTTDKRNTGVNLAAQIRIVGVYRIRDSRDPFWMNDALVAGYRLHPVGSNTVYTESDAILSQDAYAALQNISRISNLQLTYHWRFYLDMTRLDANESGNLAAALRRLEAKPPSSGVSDRPTDTLLHAGLLRLLLNHEATWQSATALLAVVATGVLFVAGTSLALVGALTSGGRRRTAALLVARGAPLCRVRATLAFEGLLLAIPAVLACVFAVLLVPGRNLVV